MLLVAGSTGEKPPAGVRGIVAFCFPSVRLCAGGSALRTPKTIPRLHAPATGVSLGKLIALKFGMSIYAYVYIGI
ncbi:hypothetical protein (plasmid) [Corynebacterium aurimucosum ATCC 700975]|uniref:Uncharacterized protein n=1 Tax=Corynebacterium aurimucosum (strain ATCC 700975 / DSM 44827 / CIP 107346 / CN-1) TaxID=548476 RepID=B3GW63_CORA7|nr:hypothetical protein [Corynebacterium aurimucosum ATCC 700975]